jgi:hypothetical protein
MLMGIHPISGDAFIFHTREIILDPKERAKKNRKPPKRKRGKR